MRSFDTEAESVTDDETLYEIRSELGEHESDGSSQWAETIAGSTHKPGKPGLGAQVF